MYKKFIVAPDSVKNIYRILSDIRETFYGQILSETINTHRLEDIDKYLELYIPDNISSKNHVRLRVIENSPEYMGLTRTHNSGLILALTHTVFYIEELVNKNIIQHIPPDRNNYARFDEAKYKVYLEKDHILGFIKKVLETKIEHYFHHPAPITIFDLELMSLNIRISNISKKNISFNKQLSPEVCIYIITNCYIKFVLPEMTKD